jgi:hypothetical protein
MQPLPRGVTGFDAPNDSVSAKRFTAACHDAARQVGGRVVEVRDAIERVTPNFDEAWISGSDGSEAVRVLCNTHHSIVAFASPAAHERDVCLELVDCPQLARVLSAGFRILGGDEAGTEISSEATAQLSDAELDQMRYWNPQRIGDLIFNYWD